MKANADQEEFAALRRLLILKRYEQPPPGYFDGFAAEISFRIRQEQTARTMIAELRSEPPWLQRVRAFFRELVFPAALGAGVCGLIVVGVARSAGQKFDPVQMAERPLNAGYSSQALPAEATFIEPVAFQSSTAGVLPEHPRFAIFPEMLESRNPAAKPWRSEL